MESQQQNSDKVPELVHFWPFGIHMPKLVDSYKQNYSLDVFSIPDFHTEDLLVI